MKTAYVIVALTIVLLAGGMTEASLAGNAMNAGTAYYAADPERALSDNWQIRDPIETGALPDGSGGVSSNSGNVSGDDAAFTFVEIGSAKYRLGVDTGP